MQIPDGFYTSPEWLAARERALARDGHRCLVARLLGGRCKGHLAVHHIQPLEDGGEPFELDNLGSACARHHPQWEALRRTLLRRRRVSIPCPLCGHFKAFAFRSSGALDQHLRDVHGVGVPEPDRELNLREVRSIVEVLRCRVLDRQRDRIAA